MSYDIRLVDPITFEELETETKHHIRGGTYQLGGTEKLRLNITYNYSAILYKMIDNEKGIRKIYGMTGAESIPLLKEAVSKLKDDIDEDYWKSTEGNVKRSLLGLIALAQLRPDGIWEGD